MYLTKWQAWNKIDEIARCLSELRQPNLAAGLYDALYDLGHSYDRERPKDIYLAIDDVSGNCINQLKAIYLLGGRWLAKDVNCNTYAYESKPYKDRLLRWRINEVQSLIPIKPFLEVTYLVSWNDVEPLNISKAIQAKT